MVYVNLYDFMIALLTEERSVCEINPFADREKVGLGVLLQFNLPVMG